jgi:hypothetical protein
VRRNTRLIAYTRRKRPVLIGQSHINTVSEKLPDNFGGNFEMSAVSKSPTNMCCLTPSPVATAIGQAHDMNLKS